jgi:hypothetical protein
VIIAEDCRTSEGHRDAAWRYKASVTGALRVLVERQGSSRAVRHWHADRRGARLACVSDPKLRPEDFFTGCSAWTNSRGEVALQVEHCHSRISRTGWSGWAIYLEQKLNIPGCQTGCFDEFTEAKQNESPVFFAVWLACAWMGPCRGGTNDTQSADLKTVPAAGGAVVELKTRGFEATIGDRRTAYAGESAAELRKNSWIRKKTAG